MQRWVAAAAIVVLVLTACGGSPEEERASLCQDLTNLEATVDFLVAPPSSATVGEVRSALDKLDAPWQAVHHDKDVPDDEDDALLDAQEAYRDEIEGIGDDDAFAPYVAATAAIAQGLGRSYDVVRVRLGCPTTVRPD